MRMQKIVLWLIIAMLFFSPIVGSSSVEIAQNSISGSITSDVGLANFNGTSNINRDIFFGTSIGVYIFSSNGKLKNFIETGSQATHVKTISDTNNNGEKELVVTTSDSYFPNVICYDSLTGEKLWDYSAEMEVYDLNMMWTMKQLPVIDLEVSSSDKIYLTAGYDVICLDENGKKLGSFESSDNMWDIALVDDDVIVGDQNGYIYRFDENIDNLAWKEKISKSYSVKDTSSNEIKGTVTRSVWDIIPIKIDGKQNLAVTCEDGYLYIVNFNNGKISKSSQIIDYVDSALSNYYLENSDNWDNPTPTNIGGFNYYNIRATKISDVNSDGNSDIAVYTYPGSRSSDGQGYQGYEQKIFIIDPSEAYTLDDKEFDGLGYVEKIGVVNNNNSEYIILPSSSSKLSLISTSDLSSSNTISLNFSLNFGQSNSYIFTDLNNDYFLLYSDQDDFLKLDFDGNIKWFYPRINDMKIEQVNLVGSKTADLLVYSQENTDSGDFLSEGSSRMIYVIDGEKRTLAWSQEISYENFTLLGGLQNVKVIDDINKDGVKDIACYMQPDNYDDWEYKGNLSFLVTISGFTGEMIYWTYIVNQSFPGWNESQEIERDIASLDIVFDVSGDGINDFIVGSENHVFILNSTNGQIVWYKSYQNSGNNSDQEWTWMNNNQLRYLSLGDKNNDGYDELLQISYEAIWILTSKINKNLDYDHSLIFSKEEEGDDVSFDRQGVYVIDDINGDNVKDIVLSLWMGDDSGDVYRVLSGDDGEQLMEFEKWGTTVDFACSDFNNDGSNDSIVFYSEGESGPKVEVWDGKNQQVIWSHIEGHDAWWLREKYSIRTISPACPAGDVNDDGYNDIAIGWFYPYGYGAELKIYDVYNDELIKTISVKTESEEAERESDRWIPTLTSVQISDVNNDGFQDIATIMPLGSSTQIQFKLVVVDAKNGEIISDFNAIGTDVKSLGGWIYTYGSSGAIYFLDPEKTLTINSPTDEKTVSSPLTISWNDSRDETMKIIMVDGKNVKKTLDDTIKIDLKKGRHKITVYSFDRNAKGVYDSIYVTVEKESKAEIPLTIIAFVLIFVLFIPKAIPVIRKSISKKKKNKEVVGK